MQDHWTCESCHELNSPLSRYCDRCWKLREFWLPVDPSHARQQTTAAHETHTKPSSLAKSDSSSSRASRNSDVAAASTSFSSDPGISSQENLSTPTTGTDDVMNSPSNAESNNASADSRDKCVICSDRPKDASIIHGKTGHQVCCYVCAKKLKRRGQPCPVCRRSIGKVIKNYLV